MKPNRVIQLPSGRCVSLGEYVRSWKALKTLNPKTQVARWGHFETGAGEILREIGRGIHDRINRHLAAPVSGLDESTENALRHLAARMNGTRIIIRPGEVPARYRSRLAHRITNPGDE